MIKVCRITKIVVKCLKYAECFETPFCLLILKKFTQMTLSSLIFKNLVLQTSLLNYNHRNAPHAIVRRKPVLAECRVSGQ